MTLALLSTLVTASIARRVAEEAANKGTHTHANTCQHRERETQTHIDTYTHARACTHV